MSKIIFNNIISSSVLFSANTCLLVDRNFIRNEHKKLINELKYNRKATLFVGEQHESLKSFTAHLELIKTIKDNNLRVGNVYLELDNASIPKISPTRGPITLTLIQAINQAFGPVVSGGLSRIYPASLRDSTSLRDRYSRVEQDLFSKCMSESGQALTIAFIGTSHIHGLKKLAQQINDKKIIAIDHSFVKPKNFSGYTRDAVALSQSQADYNVDSENIRSKVKFRLK